MKKLISFALAIVLCLGMSTTVLAAPSPNANNNGKFGDDLKVEGATEIDISDDIKKVGEGTPVAERLQADHDLLNDNADPVAKEARLKEIAASLGRNIVEVTKVSYKVFEADEALKNGQSVTITYTGNDFYEGMNLMVLHQRLSDGEWEEIKPDVVGNGYAKITLSNFSPIVAAPVVEGGSFWFYDPAIDGPVDPSLPANTPAATDAAGSSVAPKTADNSMALYVMMLAAAACGTMVVKTRKVK